MKPQALPFAVAVLAGLVAWGAVSWRYAWPRLKALDLVSAAEPILYLHLFRYVGLSFISPGVVATSLDRHWALSSALGDIGAALLAGAALLILRTKAGPPALWLFNIWGTLDLLRAFADGVPKGVNLSLHATWFIPTVFVPLLLATHAMLYLRLVHPEPLRPDFARH